MNFLAKYFPHSVEYPDPTKVMMKSGWLLSYIGSQYLKGWINYLEILDAYLITRYQTPAQNQLAVERFNIDILNTYTCNLNELGDDVLILAKEKPGKLQSECIDIDCWLNFDDKRESYWFFWFDQDSSDCCIGRFYCETPEDVLRKEFWEYCSKGPTDDIGNNRDIDITQRQPLRLRLGHDEFKGWLS